MSGSWGKALVAWLCTHSWGVGCPLLGDGFLLGENTGSLLKCDFDSASVVPDALCQVFPAAKDAVGALYPDPLWAARLKYNYTADRSVKACL